MNAFIQDIWPAWPIFVLGLIFIWWGIRRWVTRYERGNGRPAVPCSICGKKFQRGLPLEWHMNKHHFKKENR